MCLAAALVAQTAIVAPPNKYSPADDVKLGQEAADQIRQQLPVMHDPIVNGFLDAIGRRLVEAIPRELQHPEFRYSFTAINVREINAFALPGGPMFVNRGMLERAHGEGEIAGVMAHELSHVALRHATAQQSKNRHVALAELGGILAGAVVGGAGGAAISDASQGLGGLASMKFSRDFERQADLLGTHIMASAGYDPHDLAKVFQTIERESGSGGPQFLSDHPNPGNRFEYINAEADRLQIADVPHDRRAFDAVESHLADLPPAPSTREARRTGAGRQPEAAGPPWSRVEPPASSESSYDEANLFRVRVPANWREGQGPNLVTFVPPGGSSDVNGHTVLTHGVEIGALPSHAPDLQTAAEDLLQALAQGNPRLGRASGYVPAAIAGRAALHTIVSNVSEVTGRDERIDVTATRLDDGTLFYVLGVAPRDAFQDYVPFFRRLVESIELSK
jgi:Zn-dependent protease with chaperone function